VAQFFLDGIYKAWPILLEGIHKAWIAIWTFICDLDEHSSIAHEIETSIETARDFSLAKWNEYIPSTVVDHGHKFASKLGQWLDMVPDTIWETLPLTLASTLLCVVLVPWSLLKIDDFFQSVADRTRRKQNVKG
jgi:hypothetical protein